MTAKCCGENYPTWVVRGGRFGEGGNHNACNSCLPDVISWVLKHPRLPDNKMVEVRPFATIQIENKED